MRPLEGKLVVAIEQAVAAPYCTSRLADAGARVIKVERPEGDFARGYDEAANGLSSYFVWLNRGKESLRLDLKDDRDRDVLKRVIAKADAVVQNLRPGALERMGLGPESLRQERPDLIYCSISGYGESGPYAKRKAYDLLIQADAGLCSITGGPEEASRVGISIVDIATGSVAHAAVMEAFLSRVATGKGEDIRISMFDVIADWLSVPYLHARSGNPPRRIGLAHPSICPYGVFKTRDGRDILISIQNDREWKTLCEIVLEDSSMVEDPRFASGVARVENRQVTDSAVAERFGSRTRAELIPLLLEANVAFADVNDLDGLARHPHLARAALQSPAGDIDLPAPAAIHDGVRRGGGHVPELGEDNASILAEFAADLREKDE